ncbi:MAG: hypothetical protein ABEJ65_05290 [bacterium]
MSQSLAILGTDPYGITAARNFVEHSPFDRVHLVGSIPTGDDLSQFQSILDEHPPLQDQLPPAKHSDSLYQELSSAIRTIADSSGHTGGQIVDGEFHASSYQLAVEEQSQIKNITAQVLLVTAPAGLDLISSPPVILGADSAVSGLLIDRHQYSFAPSTEHYFMSEENQTLWTVKSGFKTDNHTLENDVSIFVGGFAREGLPIRGRFTGLLDQIREVAERLTDESNVTTNEDIHCEDEGMPEGFVDTKYEKLRRFLTDILVNEQEITPALVQKIEGLAGEVDSYSRFRRDPELLRLRWSTLTAMNLVRPYLKQTPAHTE